jgi:hypothetical protein
MSVHASLENILVNNGYIISKDFKNYTLVHKGSKFIGYLLTKPESMLENTAILLLTRCYSE